MAFSGFVQSTPALYAILFFWYTSRGSFISSVGSFVHLTSDSFLFVKFPDFIHWSLSLEIVLNW